MATPKRPKKCSTVFTNENSCNCAEQAEVKKHQNHRSHTIKHVPGVLLVGDVDVQVENPLVDTHPNFFLTPSHKKRVFYGHRTENSGNILGQTTADRDDELPASRQTGKVVREAVKVQSVFDCRLRRGRGGREGLTVRDRRSAEDGGAIDQRRAGG